MSFVLSSFSKSLMRTASFPVSLLYFTILSLVEVKALISAMVPVVKFIALDLT